MSEDLNPLLLALGQGGVLALLCAVCHALGQLNPTSYYRLALTPRDMNSVWRIASYPLVHINLRHLLFNLLPLIILGILIAAENTASYWLTSAVILLVGGWGTWLFSTADRVVGASGLVFGYWGYILARAALEQNSFWLAAAGLTLLLYAGLWSNLMKIEGGVSWAAHFWGLIGGIGAALLIAG